MPLPQQRGKMLPNPANKSYLFLQNQAGNPILLLAGGFEDMTRAVSVKFGTVTVSELYSDHEEADTSIFLHLHHTVMNYGVGHVILLWSCDSDVAAMCPRYVHFLGIRELFFKTDTRKKNKICANAYSSQKSWTRHVTCVASNTRTKRMSLSKCIL